MSLISDLKVTLYDIVKNKNSQFGPRYMTALASWGFFRTTTSTSKENKFFS